MYRLFSTYKLTSTQKKSRPPSAAEKQNKKMVFFFDVFCFLCVMFCSLVKIMELGTNLEQNLVPPQAIFVVFRFYLIDSWCKNRLFSTANWPQNLKKNSAAFGGRKNTFKNKKRNLFFGVSWNFLFFFPKCGRETGGVCWPHHQFSPPLLWAQVNCLMSGRSYVSFMPAYMG